MPETRVHAALVNSTGVAAIVSTRVYPIKAPQGVDRPYITYQRITTTLINGSTGVGDVEFARVQVDSWADTYTEAKALGAAVQTTLSGWSSSTGTPAIDMSHLDAEQDLPESIEPGQDALIHRVRQDYLLQYPST